MNRPHLPDFLHPPVVEVALSFQFVPLQEMRAIHLGALWSAFDRTKFPTAEEQPPIPPSVERSGTPRLNPLPQFEILNIPPLPRYLFLNPTGTEVLQIQHDRFSFNWRKGKSGGEYPRYEALLEKFEGHVATLVSFLKENQLGTIVVTQTELTYVNEIQAEALPGKLEKVVSVLSGTYSDNSLGDPEETRLSLKYPIYSEASFSGRLHVDVRPSNLLETQSGINLVLLARGKSDGSDINSVVTFLGLARKTIVTAFASLTSKEMHKTWGRIDHE